MLEPILDFRPLVAHPDFTPASIPSAGCSISWGDIGEWSLGFIVAVPPDALRLPPAAVPARADGLWQRTCFELFLREPDSDAYFEFNFSPSGQWAAYRFDGYRAGRTDLEIAPPRIMTADPTQRLLSTQFHFPQLDFDAAMMEKLADIQKEAGLGPPTQFGLSVDFEDPSLPAGRDWLAGLSAIVEESDGTRSYWALAHPPGQPDFHHPDCFALDLPAANPAAEPGPAGPRRAC